MEYDLVTVGAHRYAVLSQRASPEQEQLEITLAGTRTVLWGERYRDRLWLWTASGRQIVAHTLGAPLRLPGDLNPLLLGAVEAAVQRAEASHTHRTARAA